MTPDDFFTPLKGQSLLLPGQAEAFRGQCVQNVGLWVQALGHYFPAYPFAYLYYIRGIDGFDSTPAGEPIQAGDLVIWGKNFPSSPGAGHIDVAASDSSLQDFYGWDSNWSPPLKLNKIHHTGSDNNYIVGYLRAKGDIVAGITIKGAPASVSWSKERIDVFARGSDDGLWHKWYTDGNFQSWERIGGGIASSPSVSSWEEGRLDIFATGIAGDLMHFWYDGSFHGPESLGVISN